MVDYAGKEMVGIWYYNVYVMEERYGGPEEGGWWYNDLELLYSEPINAAMITREQSEKRCDELVKKFDRYTVDEKQRRINLSHMPDGPNPYLDTDGYIPRHFSDGGEVICSLGRYGKKGDTYKENAHYE